MPGMPDRSATSPEAIIDSVRSRTSSPSMPRIAMAMSIAAIW